MTPQIITPTRPASQPAAKPAGKIRSPKICAAAAAGTFSWIGKSWILLTMHAICCGGANSFNEIKRSLGTISSRTLSDRLKELERRGMLERVVVSDRPLKVEYRLTEKANDFHRVVLNSALDWTGRWEQDRPASAVKKS